MYTRQPQQNIPCLMMFKTFPPTPTTSSILHKASRHTVSKAALTSMKLKCMGTLCSLAFSMIRLTIKMASTVPFNGRKPYWLSLAKVSICSRTLFRIILRKTIPGMQFSVMALWFSAINLSPFLWVGMSRSFDQSVGVLYSLHILFIILCSICSIAGPPFFITSAMNLSCPGDFSFAVVLQPI